MNTNGNDVERRGSDVMQTLKAADPAALADLSRTDERAFTTLREGIALTPHDARSNTVRRARRVLTTAGLALALVGGGAAYATYDQWFGRDGGDDVACLSAWVDPQTDSDFASANSGGPLISTDPVADCQQYQQLSGKPAIADPVAFTYKGMLMVAPSSEMPDSGSRIAPPSGDAVATERLEQSLDDRVDGGMSRCFDLESGTAFVKAEFERLGLVGWSVVEPPPQLERSHDGPCGRLFISGNGREVVFYSRDQHDPSKAPPGMQSTLPAISAELRRGIVDTCVSLSQAKAVAEGAMDAKHHWPTSATTDESMKCTTVDFVVQGSMQVFLRGPSTIAK